MAILASFGHAAGYRLGRAVLTLGTDTTQFTRGLQDAESKALRSSQRVAQMGKDMSLAIAVPFAGFSAAAIAMAADYEATMKHVKAVSSATAVQFEKLKQQTKDLAETTKFTMKQVGEGQTYLAMAGLQVKTILGSMPQVLDLATASGLELGRTADLLTNIMTAFSLEAKDTVSVMDTLTTTFTNSNTSMEQLAEAMKYVAPVAGALGHTVSETAAAIGVLGDKGIQASLAGTYLRAMFGELVGPSKKLQGRLTELGIGVRDLEGNLKSAAAVVREIEDKGLDPSIGFELLRRRGGTGLTSLIEAGADDIEKMMAMHRTQVGETKRIAEEMIDSMVGDMQIAYAKIQTFMVKFAESGMFQLVRQYAQGFHAFADSMNKSTTETLRFYAALGVTLSIFPLGITAVGLFAARMVALVIVFKRIAAMTASLRTMVTLMKAMKAAALGMSGVAATQASFDRLVDAAVLSRQPGFKKRPGPLPPSAGLLGVPGVASGGALVPVSRGGAMVPFGTALVPSAYDGDDFTGGGAGGSGGRRRRGGRRDPLDRMVAAFAQMHRNAIDAANASNKWRTNAKSAAKDMAKVAASAKSAAASMSRGAAAAGRGGAAGGAATAASAASFAGFGRKPPGGYGAAYARYRATEQAIWEAQGHVGPVPIPKTPKGGVTAWYYKRMQDAENLRRKNWANVLRQSEKKRLWESGRLLGSAPPMLLLGEPGSPEPVTRGGRMVDPAKMLGSPPGGHHGRVFYGIPPWYAPANPIIGKLGRLPTMEDRIPLGRRTVGFGRPHDFSGMMYGNAPDAEYAGRGWTYKWRKRLSKKEGTKPFEGARTYNFLRGYYGAGTLPIYGAIRGGDTGSISASDEQFLRRAHGAMRPLPKDTVLYRGITHSNKELFSPGQIFIDPAPSHVTSMGATAFGANRDVLAMRGGSAKDQPYTFVIRARKGLMAYPYDKTNDEFFRRTGELMLPAGSQFRVARVVDSESPLGGRKYSSAQEDKWWESGKGGGQVFKGNRGKIVEMEYLGQPHAGLLQERNWVAAQRNPTYALSPGAIIPHPGFMERDEMGHLFRRRLEGTQDAYGLRAFETQKKRRELVRLLENARARRAANAPPLQLGAGYPGANLPALAGRPNYTWAGVGSYPSGRVEFDMARNMRNAPLMLGAGSAAANMIPFGRYPKPWDQMRGSRDTVLDPDRMRRAGYDVERLGLGRKDGPGNTRQWAGVGAGGIHEDTGRKAHEQARAQREAARAANAQADAQRRASTANRQYTRTAAESAKTSSRFRDAANRASKGVRGMGASVASAAGKVGKGMRGVGAAVSGKALGGIKSFAAAFMSLFSVIGSTAFVGKIASIGKGIAAWALSIGGVVTGLVLLAGWIIGKKIFDKIENDMRKAALAQMSYAETIQEVMRLEKELQDQRTQRAAREKRDYEDYGVGGDPLKGTRWEGKHSDDVEKAEHIEDANAARLAAMDKEAREQRRQIHQIYRSFDNELRLLKKGELSVESFVAGISHLNETVISFGEDAKAYFDKGWKGLFEDAQVSGEKMAVLAERLKPYGQVMNDLAGEIESVMVGVIGGKIGPGEQAGLLNDAAEQLERLRNIAADHGVIDILGASYDKLGTFIEKVRNMSGDAAAGLGEATAAAVSWATELESKALPMKDVWDMQSNIMLDALDAAESQGLGLRSPSDIRSFAKHDGQIVEGLPGETANELLARLAHDPLAEMEKEVIGWAKRVGEDFAKTLINKEDLAQALRTSFQSGAIRSAADWSAEAFGGFFTEKFSKLFGTGKYGSKLAEGFASAVTGAVSGGIAFLAGKAVGGLMSLFGLGKSEDDKRREARAEAAAEAERQRLAQVKSDWDSLVQSIIEAGEASESFIKTLETNYPEMWATHLAEFNEQLERLVGLREDLAKMSGFQGAVQDLFGETELERFRRTGQVGEELRRVFTEGGGDAKLLDNLEWAVAARDDFLEMAAAFEQTGQATDEFISMVKLLAGVDITPLTEQLEKVTGLFGDASRLYAGLGNYGKDGVAEFLKTGDVRHIADWMKEAKAELSSYQDYESKVIKYFDRFTEAVDVFSDATERFNQHQEDVKEFNRTGIASSSLMAQLVGRGIKPISGHDYSHIGQILSGVGRYRSKSDVEKFLGGTSMSKALEAVFKDWGVSEAAATLFQGFRRGVSSSANPAYDAYKNIYAQWARGPEVGGAEGRADWFAGLTHGGYSLTGLFNQYGAGGYSLDDLAMMGQHGEFGMEALEGRIARGTGVEEVAVSAMEEAANKIYEAAENQSEKLQDAITEITQMLSDGVNEAAEELRAALEPIMELLGEKVESLQETLAKAIKEATKALNDGVIAAAKAVDAKLSTVVSSLSNSVNAVISAVYAIADRLAAGINVVVQVNTPDPVTPVVVEPPDTDEEEIDDDTGFPRYPGRAYGGHVKAGRPYTVGEYGREVFVPRVDGDLIPSYNAASPVGRDAEGGGTAVNLNINVESSNDPDLVVQAVRDAFEDNAGHLRDLLQEGV